MRSSFTALPLPSASRALRRAAAGASAADARTVLARAVGVTLLIRPFLAAFWQQRWHRPQTQPSRRRSADGGFGSTLLSSSAWRAGTAAATSCPVVQLFKKTLTAATRVDNTTQRILISEKRSWRSDREAKVRQP